MDSKLKVIIDFLIQDAQEAGNTEFILNVPDDYRALLYNSINDVASYLKSKGYSTSTNSPTEGSWRGWDIVPIRQAAFPPEFAVGKSHSNYQLMTSTPKNITVKATLLNNVIPQ